MHVTYRPTNREKARTDDAVPSNLRFRPGMTRREHDALVAARDWWWTMRQASIEHSVNNRRKIRIKEP